MIEQPQATHANQKDTMHTVGATAELEIADTLAQTVSAKKQVTKKTQP